MKRKPLSPAYKGGDRLFSFWLLNRYMFWGSGICSLTFIVRTSKGISFIQDFSCILNWVYICHCFHLHLIGWLKNKFKCQVISPFNEEIFRTIKKDVTVRTRPFHLGEVFPYYQPVYDIYHTLYMTPTTNNFNSLPL